MRNVFGCIGNTGKVNNCYFLGLIKKKRGYDELKITDIHAMILSYDFENEIADALSYYPRRNAVIVIVDTDSGLVGIGESACFGGPPESTKNIIEGELKQYVIGEDPTNVERIWQRIWYGSRHHGRRGLLLASMSGIDIALWDLIGKQARMPLYRLWGGYAEKIKTYASAGFYQKGKGARELAKEVESYLEDGFQYVKIKVGRTPETMLCPTGNMPHGDQSIVSLEEDLARVEACAKVIKDRGKLMVDVNNAWTPSIAIQMGREFEKMGIYWIEEPVATDDILGSAEVARALDIPIAGYESETGMFGFYQLIKNRAVDIVQPDVVWAGGFSECKRIAALAAAHNLPVIPHVFSSAVSLVANMHFIASIPNGYLLEFDRNPYPLRDDLITERVRIDQDSYVKLPEKPGLGISLDEGIVEKYKSD